MLQFQIRRFKKSQDKIINIEESRMRQMFKYLQQELNETLLLAKSILLTNNQTLLMFC